MREFDVAVIGCGPAGMTAAIYAARAGKSVCVIDDNIGGQMSKSPRIENYPSIEVMSGAEIADKMYNQMLQYPIEHVLSKATKIENNTIYIEDEEDVVAKAIIIATGATHRELPGIDPELVSYCATCDGPFYTGKDVIVVGSGNTGATYALDLSNYCNKVYLCDITDHMLCEDILQKRILGNNKIEWLPQTTIASATEEQVILNSGKSLTISRIFAAIGMIPATEFFLGESKYISTGDDMKVTDHIFAAGDCRSKNIRQIVTAVNDGAIAAISAVRYIDSQST